MYSKLIVDALAGHIHRQFHNGTLRERIGRPNTSGYLQFAISQEAKVLNHRWIYSHFHGPLAPWMEIDHIHGKEAGNGIANLRRIDRNGNMQNFRKARSDNKSTGLLGVHQDPSGRYRSQIRTSGKLTYLGMFDTAEEAHDAYVRAKREKHETCTI